MVSGHSSPSHRLSSFHTPIHCLTHALPLWVQGTAVYMPEKSCLVWTIKSFPGGREFMLRCHFNLPSVAAEDDNQGKMPPIKVKFEIPYYTVSGIQVGRR
jgi:hypothetical protein